MSDGKMILLRLKKWIAATIAILSACMVDSEKYTLFLFLFVISTLYLIKDSGGFQDDE